MELRYKVWVERELECAAAELLAAVKAGGRVEERVKVLVGDHGCHVCDGTQLEEVGEEGFAFVFGAVGEELG